MHELALDDRTSVSGRRPNLARSKLGHRLQLDRLIEIVDQSGAGLPNSSIDYHRADAAHLFKAVHAPDRWRRCLAFTGHRIFLNLHQAGDDVEIRTVRNTKPLPIWLRIGVSSSPDVEFTVL